MAPRPLTPEQEAKLAKLTKLIKKGRELSEKQGARLAALQARAAASQPEPKKTKANWREDAAASAAPAAPSRKGATSHVRFGESSRTEPVPKEKAAAVLCTDEGYWGDDGEWVYPADCSIRCVECDEAFVFKGTQASYYAQNKLYAPTRCPDCVQAKRERFGDKSKTERGPTSGDGRCFNCGQTGHRSSECPRPRSEGKACYVCGSFEHVSRNCPSVPASTKKKGGACHICGSTQHFSRECPDRPPPMCFNCGAEGHASKACPKPERTSGKCFAFANGQCFRKNCPFDH
jgi:cellular nucleic acid-binding protein